MNTTWLVIANETNANIYKINKKEFELIDNLKHPESRLTDHELVSDRPGHYRTPDTAHGAYVPDSDPHELEKVIFARTIIIFPLKATSRVLPISRNYFMEFNLQ